MTSEKFEQQVAALEELGRDTKAQAEIGRRLVREVAQAVLMERKGAEIEEPDMELNIRKGDPVPAQLADRIKTDAKGLAAHDASVQFQNLIIWLRVWIRFWLRIYIPWVLRDTPLNRFEDFAERVTFSPDEMQQLDRLRSIAK